MNRMNFGIRSGIVLDVCRAHGTWFDGGELGAVLDFVREGGIESEMTPRGPPPRNEEAEGLLRVAQAELHAENVQFEHAVHNVTNVLFFLFSQTRW
jgi:Zn-finger nucleic acid-binding protein